MEHLDIKLLLSILSVPLTVFLFIPYIRDTLKGKTKPHIYTWFIWAITMSIALIGGYQGGGKLLLVTLGIPTIFVVCTFLLCFKYGTKDITKFDIGILSLAIFNIYIYNT